MPTFLASSTSAQTLSSADHFILPSGEVILDGADDAIILAAAGITLSVAGALMGERGIYDPTSNDGQRIDLTASSSIIGTFGGIEVAGDEIEINAGGSITAAGGVGLGILGDDAQVWNSGTITGRTGLELLGGDGTLVNSGTIEGRTGLVLDGDHTIINSGNILGVTYGINSSPGLAPGVTVTNSGTISGASGSLSLSSDNDVVLNSGSLLGTVFLGSGNDRYEATGDGSVTGRIYGMGDDDILLGASAADIIDGGTGEDIIRGRDGDDYLRGRAQLDQIFGGNGDDIILGDEGSDRLWGGAGSDVIDGGTMNDIIRGGAGADIITGGAGRDVMFGGAGEDRFVFNFISESGVFGARDAIRDFDVTEDVIDFSGLLDGELSYLGESNFTGAGMEFRHVTTAWQSSVVRVDVDGDLVQDMEILVQFVPTLSQDDFLL